MYAVTDCDLVNGQVDWYEREFATPDDAIGSVLAIAERLEGCDDYLSLAGQASLVSVAESGEVVATVCFMRADHGPKKLRPVVTRLR